MRLIFIIPFICFAIVGNAQKIKKMKHSEIIVNSVDSTIKAKILLKNKNIKAKHSINYFWYNADKIDNNMVGYYGKLLDNKYVVFDKQRNLITEGSFKNGVKSKVWKTWYGNGKIKSIENWKNGHKQGKCIYYSANGTYNLYTYKKGIKHGKHMYWTPDTVITQKYKKGKIELPKPKNPKIKNDTLDNKNIDKKDTEQKEETPKVKKGKKKNTEEKIENNESERHGNNRESSTKKNKEKSQKSNISKSKTKSSDEAKPKNEKKSKSKEKT